MAVSSAEPTNEIMPHQAVTGLIQSSGMALVSTSAPLDTPIATVTITPIQKRVLGSIWGILFSYAANSALITPHVAGPASPSTTSGGCCVWNALTAALVSSSSGFPLTANGGAQPSTFSAVCSADVSNVCRHASAP